MRDDELARMVETSRSFLLDHNELDRRRLIEFADRAYTDRAQAEYQRFCAVERRALPRTSSPERLSRLRVLVTGGTGTIGTELISQLAGLGVGSVVSIARGRTVGRAHRGVRHVHVDVRDRVRVDRIFEIFRPDLVFHLAAVRSPREAELAPHAAIHTNVLGTMNVLHAARKVGVRIFVYASTGKAVRFYTEDIYAASKKVGEWMVAATASEMTTAATRFTHVVDNSLIHAKLKRELNQGLLTLHAPHMAMYAQSAKESAQLLIEAAIHARPLATHVLSLRNLEGEFDLTELALGLRAAAQRSIPLAYEGYEAGYESSFYPGLYDFAVGDTGPLVNRFEAARTTPLLDETVNSFMLTPVVVSPQLGKLLAAAQAPQSTGRLVDALHEFSRAALTARLLGEVPATVSATLKAAVGAARPEGQPSRDHATTTNLLGKVVSKALEVS